MAWDGIKPATGSKLVAADVRDNFTALNTPGFLYTGAHGVSGSGFLSNAKRVDSLGSTALTFSGTTTGAGTAVVTFTNSSSGTSTQKTAVEVNGGSAIFTGGSTAISYGVRIDGGIATNSSAYSYGLSVAAGSESGGGSAYSAIFTGGEVGIGTTTPRTTLDVVGEIIASTNIGIGTTNPRNNLDVVGDGIFSASVGIATTNPLNPLHLQDTANVISGSNIDVSELQMVIANSDNTNNEGLGIGFRMSTVAANIGAAIAFERTDSESQGKLHFASKVAAVSGADLPIGLTVYGTNVGIGTTTPAYPLEIFPGASSSGRLRVGNTLVGHVGHSGFAGFGYYSHTSGNDYAIIADSSGRTYINSETGVPIFFRHNNVTVMTLDAGELGIGTTTPRQDLDVIGAGIFSTNVGIGTASPRQELDVVGTGIFSTGVGIGTTTTATELRVQGDAVITGELTVGTLIGSRQLLQYGRDIAMSATSGAPPATTSSTYQLWGPYHDILTDDVGDVMLRAGTVTAIGVWYDITNASTDGEVELVLYKNSSSTGMTVSTTSVGSTGFQKLTTTSNPVSFNAEDTIGVQITVRESDGDTLTIDYVRAVIEVTT